MAWRRAETLLATFLLVTGVFSWQITDGVKPTLSELEKFEDQPEGLDLEVVTESGDFHTPQGRREGRSSSDIPVGSSRGRCCRTNTTGKRRFTPGGGNGVLCLQGRSENTTCRLETTWRCVRGS